MAFNLQMDHTRSTTYILPLLGNNRADFPSDSHTFLGDVNREEFKNKILLLIKKRTDPWFVQNLESLILKEEYETSYDCNNNYLMLVYNIPEKYKDNYFKFKEGKYSLFDDEYKRKVLSFHNLGTHSAIGKVLYRDITLYKEWEKVLGVPIPRTQEIGNMPNLKEEYYNEGEMNKVKLRRLSKNEHQ